MNTIFSPKKGDLAQIMNKEHRMSNVERNRTSEEGLEESISPYHDEINITEGGEFLDDAIRMEDLDEETNKNPSQEVS
jgi:hypothetical protein